MRLAFMIYQEGHTGPGRMSFHFDSFGSFNWRSTQYISVPHIHSIGKPFIKFEQFLGKPLANR